MEVIRERTNLAHRRIGGHYISVYSWVGYRYSTSSIARPRTRRAIRNGAIERKKAQKKEANMRQVCSSKSNFS